MYWNFRSVVVAAVFGFSAIVPGSSTAMQSIQHKCDSKWEELSDRLVTTTPNYAALQSEWLSLAGVCGDHVRYRPRLALIQYYLDKPQLARETLASIREGDGKAEPLVELVQILIDAALMERGGRLSREELRNFEQRLTAYVKQHPSDVVGISFLADVSGEIGRHDLAVSLYKRLLPVLEGSGRQWGVLRNLTIASVSNEQYKEAYEYGGQAIALNRELFKDIPFMCSIARALVLLGRIDAAKDALTLLATKREDAVKNAEFLEAVQFVKNGSK